MRRDDARLTRALTETAPDLLGYFQRRVGPDDAPDLLGETMVSAWKRVVDLPGEPERARMWLFGIARNVLLNHRRGERRRWALADRIRGYSSRAAAAPAADDGAEVRDAIQRLDADLGELVRLIHWERMTLVQAAELLGIPGSTARTRYARAKELLRASLTVDVH
ncbi:RNA polymerase sigma factor [Gryllotalpicola protaetiae]|uniref:RNA polymerase sigma factor n=1 Tax=Gryllotalpicola protaetiae TaxID=2419771 RepID=A0A387BKJ3_9MICO|nr:RNA polymerase sigma factor [Gryllotalpicola protaetiae]AYG04665.1 RNA polymerase sigma factor [Gryllotalpicola protaetiae]